MKNFFNPLLHSLIGLFVLFFSFWQVTAYADYSSPEGVWQTFNEKTHLPVALVQLSQQDGKLNGKVIKIFPIKGKSPPYLCTKCSGDFYNKPILGMTLLWGLTPQSNGTWSGGKILDPNNGQIYDVEAQLLNGGRNFQVRGFIGLSFMGRTEVWSRIQ